MAQVNLLAGRYRLQEQVGSGGMCVVYRAIDQRLAREVAVKALPPQLAMEPGYGERFMREAYTLAQLQHPHILPIHDYLNDSNGTFLIMPLLRGGTLGQRMRQRSQLPSMAEVRELSLKLIDALQHAHAKTIIHRDIKPANVMFNESGHPYLLDFGIAKLLHDEQMTRTGLPIGTAPFMPPEQWRGDAISPAADQYALAILIFALLSGRLPFEGSSPEQLMYKHLNQQAPRLHDLDPRFSPTLSAVIEKALSKEPHHRYPNISAFGQDLKTALQDAGSQETGFFNFPVQVDSRPVFTDASSASFISTGTARATAQQTPSGSRPQMWLLTGVLTFFVLVVAIIVSFLLSSPPVPIAQTTAPATATVDIIGSQQAIDITASQNAIAVASNVAATLDVIVREQTQSSQPTQSFTEIPTETQLPLASLTPSPDLINPMESTATSVAATVEFLNFSGTEAAVAATAGANASLTALAYSASQTAAAPTAPSLLELSIPGLPVFVSAPQDWASFNSTEACPGLQTANLDFPAFAVVEAQDGVRVRTEPSLNGRQIAGVPPEAHIAVLSNRVCNDGYEWWLVNYYGSIGWSTGADAEESWLRSIGQGAVIENPLRRERSMAFQFFEHGYMLWIEGFQQIFVLYDNGSWVPYVDRWREGDNIGSPLGSPPNRRYQPIRGFGKVWAENPEVYSGLSWATGPEIGAEGSYVYDFGRDMSSMLDFERLQGFRVIEAPDGQIYTLFDNGAWE